MSDVPAETVGDALLSALFRALLQDSSGYVGCIDRERRCLFVNRSLSRDPSEFIGKPFETFVTPAHRDAAVRAVEQAYESGEPGQLEYTVVAADGSHRHISARLVPFKSPLGHDLALMLMDDVTDQRQMAAELERSQDFRRRVVEHLPDFVSLIDRDHRFVWVNRLAPGLAMSDVIGKDLSLFQAPESLPAARAAISAAFDGHISQYESEGYKDGQSKAWYQVRVVPVVLESRVENVLLITSDITERKRAEHALRQAEEQLHRAQRLESLGQVAGGIAHDFNNLLQVIDGNLSFALQLLGKGSVPLEEIEQSLRATRRAAELTSHLLTIGRRKRVDTKRLELGELVATAVRMLRRAVPDHIVIRYDRPASPCFVELDAPQFEQVLLNLCVNARDAMADGGALTIRIAPDGPLHVVMSVADTGCGIMPENLTRVFEPFFTTKGTGSGLGLAVAAGIVGAHGGLITAESDGVTGTVMKVRLPLVAAGAEADAPNVAATSRASGTILVADDEEMVRAQAVRILEDAGYTVLQASDGARAVELFRQNRSRVDLVLLDAIMPDLDGWQAFLQMQALEPGVKVLFTTGYAADVLPEDFAARGARLLSKPYKSQALVTNVHELLDTTS